MAEKKIALLSNVNMNFVIRMLGKETPVYAAEGYGNELGSMMNPASSYHEFAPEITFLVMDLMELLEHDLDLERARSRMAGWFATLEGAIKEDCVYYISDAYLWGVELTVCQEVGHRTALEGCWLEALEQLCARRQNVRILPYHHMIEELGERNAFSLKMWYMGRILLSNEAQKSLYELIRHKLALEGRVAKKVLLLDLDNTLWGGLAGEAEHTPVQLSEEHGGLCYKNLQRVILQMQRQGVLLGIVSKNNREDAMSILQEHPHMLLRPDCFVAMRINWQPKHENILEIARELNLGVDSFVFWDDNPTERHLIQEMLPQVVVPDFPDKAEELAPSMAAIYKDYFEKAALTSEDVLKTKQYAANAERSRLAESAVSFADYLKQLKIIIRRVPAAAHTERLTQLVNKTNQFNLTTKRYELAGIQRLVTDPAKRVYLYQTEDCFGDNGIVAAVIVALPQQGQDGGPDGAGNGDPGLSDMPLIEEFVMSCRVMGKNIEYGILEDVEQDLLAAGYGSLRGLYYKTPKNRPVEKLYKQAGYEREGALKGDGVSYVLTLADAPQREYYVADFIRETEE